MILNKRRARGGAYKIKIIIYLYIDKIELCLLIIYYYYY